ncbi:hypothetical protein [Tsukamurella sp. NPDC003166]|uniref:hypothetical protein n=1 Tax=Tsukamurella sp. NPDC003166 TaxID=3154444 RepID=UPI0033AC4D46
MSDALDLADHVDDIQTRWHERSFARRWKEAGAPPWDSQGAYLPWPDDDNETATEGGIQVRHQGSETATSGVSIRSALRYSDSRFRARLDFEVLFTFTEEIADATVSDAEPHFLETDGIPTSLGFLLAALADGARSFGIPAPTLTPADRRYFIEEAVAAASSDTGDTDD